MRNGSMLLFCMAAGGIWLNKCFGGGVLVVVNTASGTMNRAAERERLRALLEGAKFVEVTDGGQIAGLVDADGSDVVVAAGGDGTVSAVAARIAGTERTLGV